LTGIELRTSRMVAVDANQYTIIEIKLNVENWM
jgi:hypothetical protein